MTTAADGAGEFYTCENNAARSESPEEAVRLDKVRNVPCHATAIVCALLEALVRAR